MCPWPFCLPGLIPRSNDVSIPVDHCCPKAADGTRTHDLVLTKDALYQLSYSSPSSSLAGELCRRLIEHAGSQNVRLGHVRQGGSPRAWSSYRVVCRFRGLFRVSLSVRVSLSHCHARKRVKGIEPSSLAWKAMALPLSYTRVSLPAASRFELSHRERTHRT